MIGDYSRKFGHKMYQNEIQMSALLFEFILNNGGMEGSENYSSEYIFRRNSGYALQNLETTFCSIEERTARI